MVIRFSGFFGPIFPASREIPNFDLRFTINRPELFMRAKHVHGMHSVTSYNRTIHHDNKRSAPT